MGKITSTVPTALAHQKKTLCYWSDCNENLWKHVNSKNNFGICGVFPVFFADKVIHRKWEKGVRGKKTSVQTVQSTESIFISTEEEMFAQQKCREFFFSFQFSFLVTMC